MLGVVVEVRKPVPVKRAISCGVKRVPGMVVVVGDVRRRLMYLSVFSVRRRFKHGER